MKKASRSTGSKPKQPRPVAAPALPQAQGALESRIIDDPVAIGTQQHNETLVRDDRSDR